MTDSLPATPASRRAVTLLVIVAALGYFVDLYDLVLFGVVRIPSLKSLGLQGDELTNVGLHLLNWQMAGMLLGGFAWGVLGDKRGRLSVLYGSILTYSLANTIADRSTFGRARARALGHPKHRTDPRACTRTCTRAN
jgi:MFS family permease